MKEYTLTLTEEEMKTLREALTSAAYEVKITPELSNQIKDLDDKLFIIYHDLQLLKSKLTSTLLTEFRL